MEAEYDLCNIKSNFADMLNNPNLESSKDYIYKQWRANNKNYSILKYNKTNLEREDYSSKGLLRSIIFSNNKINVFSPPKSLNYEKFINKYPVEECFAEEFIEGTMINIFYDSDVNKWEIATKTSVGAKMKYFREQPNFNELFNDICKTYHINIENFNKEYIYSFVMQHPKNRFILPLIDTRLYIIAVYKVENLIIKLIPRENYHMLNMDEIFSKIWFPYRFNFDQYSDLRNYYGSMNTDINYMGIVINHKNGMRTKIRNPNYEYIKLLKGNNPKLQYQYLCLRYSNRVKEYLEYFPESKEIFASYRKQLHDYTNELYNNYIRCYIRKEQPLNKFPIYFRTHMYNIHQIYLSIKDTMGYIHKSIVVNYINKLEPAKLMYYLNYPLRNIKESEEKMELD